MSDGDEWQHIYVKLAVTGTLEQQKTNFGWVIDVSTCVKTCSKFGFKLREVELITEVSQKVSGLLSKQVRGGI